MVKKLCQYCCPHGNCFLPEVAAVSAGFASLYLMRLHVAFKQSQLHIFAQKYLIHLQIVDLIYYLQKIASIAMLNVNVCYNCYHRRIIEMRVKCMNSYLQKLLKEIICKKLNITVYNVVCVINS